jgi:very-short-patch-repair endonuclease
MAGSKLFYCSHPCYLKFNLARKGPHPNIEEQKLLKILEPYGFKYTGRGQVMIGKKNPDFVHRKRKLIVELFGEYWHWQREVAPRILFFKQRGYRAVVFWAKELVRPDKIKMKVEELLKAA